MPFISQAEAVDTINTFLKDSVFGEWHLKTVLIPTNTRVWKRRKEAKQYRKKSLLLEAGIARMQYTDIEKPIYDIQTLNSEEMLFENFFLTKESVGITSENLTTIIASSESENSAMLYSNKTMYVSWNEVIYVYTKEKTLLRKITFSKITRISQLERYLRYKTRTKKAAQ